MQYEYTHIVRTALWPNFALPRFFLTATLCLLLPFFNSKLQVEGKDNIDDIWSHIWSQEYVYLFIFIIHSIFFHISQHEFSLRTYALKILTVQKYAVLDTPHVHVVSSLIKFGWSCFRTELIQLLYVTILLLTCPRCEALYICRFLVILTLMTVNLPNLIQQQLQQ